MANEQELLSACGAVEAVVPDLREALGKDVKKEAVDECFCRERAALDARCPVVPIAEGDFVVFEAFDAGVGDSDAKYVAGEVLQNLVAGAGVLEVNDPFLVG